MIISAELSLYPLSADYEPVIRYYIAALRAFEALDVRTHAMSTEIYGDYDTVMAAIQSATRAVFEQDNSAVLVAKFLNRDRRV